MWDLIIVPWPGIKPGPLAWGVQSLSHWTTREVPGVVLLKLTSAQLIPCSKPFIAPHCHQDRVQASCADVYSGCSSLWFHPACTLFAPRVDSRGPDFSLCARYSPTWKGLPPPHCLLVPCSSAVFCEPPRPSSEPCLSQRSSCTWRQSHSLGLKWHPTPVFLPGEAQGRGSLVGCCPWGHTESDTTEVT